MHILQGNRLLLESGSAPQLRHPSPVWETVGNEITDPRIKSQSLWRDSVQLSGVFCPTPSVPPDSGVEPTVTIRISPSSVCGWVASLRISSQRHPSGFRRPASEPGVVLRAMWSRTRLWWTRKPSIRADVPR